METLRICGGEEECVRAVQGPPADAPRWRCHPALWIISAVSCVALCCLLGSAGAAHVVPDAEALSSAQGSNEEPVRRGWWLDAALTKVLKAVLVGLALVCLSMATWPWLRYRCIAPDMAHGQKVWSFRISAARWNAFRKAEWGICGRSTKFAFFWPVLLELLVAAGFGVIVLVIAIIRWIQAELMDVDLAVDLLVQSAFTLMMTGASAVAFWRLGMLVWSLMGLRIMTPPLVTIVKDNYNIGADLGEDSSVSLFFLWYYKVSTAVCVVDEIDGPVLTFTLFGARSKRPFVKTFFTVQVPLEYDFDKSTLSRAGLNVIAVARPGVDSERSVKQLSAPDSLVATSIADDAFTETQTELYETGGGPGDGTGVSFALPDDEQSLG